MLGIITRLNIFHSRKHILYHTIFRLLQRPFAKNRHGVLPVLVLCIDMEPIYPFP